MYKRIGESRPADARLAAVLSGARAILAQQSFVETARAIFDKCREMTAATMGYVALLGPGVSEHEILLMETAGEPCTVTAPGPMAIRGLRALAYDTHQTVYENDFVNTSWAAYLPTGHVDLYNVLFAPLNVDGETVGILGLANKPGGFIDADAEIAAIFGELAAIALLNSRHIDLLNERTASLERALAEVRTLQGLLPICTKCKNIRDDAGLWTRIDTYLTEHADIHFSHGLCPECLRELYPEEAAALLVEPMSTAQAARGTGARAPLREG